MLEGDRGSQFRTYVESLVIEIDMMLLVILLQEFRHLFG